MQRKKHIKPKARKNWISLEASPYYHCTSRGVKSAFLCYIDNQTADDFESAKAMDCVSFV